MDTETVYFIISQVILFIVFSGFVLLHKVSR